jgi:hypothetical protein
LLTNEFEVGYLEAKEFTRRPLGFAEVPADPALRRDGHAVNGLVIGQDAAERVMAVVLIRPGGRVMRLRTRG